MDILFGTIDTVRTSGSSEQTTKDFIQLGKVVSQQTTYHETIKITEDQQVLTYFLQLMDYVKASISRCNPEFKVFTDAKTGKVYKMTRSWTERS